MKLYISGLMRTILLLTFAGSLPLAAAHAQKCEVASPNRAVMITVDTSKGGNLSYRVTFKKQPVVLPSALGVLLDGQNLGSRVTLGKASRRSAKETYATFGNDNTATNEYQEALLPVTGGAKPTPWTLEVRAYNDGVAYRYRIPGSGKRYIEGEASGWSLPDGSTLWYQDDRNRSYEAPYVRSDAGAVATGVTLAAPAAVKLPGTLGYAMLTEANLVNYSDMVLKATGPGTFAATFPNDAGGWDASGEIVSPWRVTMVASDLNTLVNSDLVKNLCPPPAKELQGAKWIRPGRSSWHWLYSGAPKFAEQRQWVDWTKQMGFEYYLIDDGWKDWKDKNKDAWANLKDIIDYAKSQGVEIFAWVNSNEVFTPAQRREYFAKAKAAGVVGLKIDFPNPANVEWVNWYVDTSRDIAAYQLMVDYHGALKPTGLERTFPNELTREAIRGRENGKQTPLHDTTLPFLRYVQGPADFTPAEFRPDRLRQSSFAHELAQAVVYTSPFLCYGGGPQDFLASPARDLIKAIPAVWDETRVLPDSEIGELAVFARRTGNDWFIGIVNGADARTISVDLGFLGAGDYTAEQFGDSPERTDAWSQSTNTVNRKTKLAVSLRSSGGYVARITRKP